MTVKFHYQVGRLQGGTLKLGEYKVNALGKSVSMASLVLQDSFIYGLPRLIETKNTICRTAERTKDAQYVPINYRANIPQEVCQSLLEVLSGLNLVGGNTPWTSQYVLVLEVSDRMLPLNCEDSCEFQTFYRGLYLLDGNGSIIFKHNPKKRRGKNNKDYR